MALSSSVMCSLLILSPARAVNQVDLAARRKESVPFDQVDQVDQVSANGRRSAVSATLKLTHKAIGAEVRRAPYEVVLDGERAGSVAMNDTFEKPIEPGRHTLKVRSGRNSSRTRTFDAADGETVAFRCTGKSILPVFLLSFVVPSLALSLHRE